MESQLIVRLDADLKVKMQKLAQAEGKNTSQVVRELIEEYTYDRDMSGYIERLWDRIGNDFQSRGIGKKDVDAAIRAVRGQKS